MLLFAQLLSTIGSVASLFALYITMRPIAPIGAFEAALGVLALVFLVGAVWFDVRGYLTTKPIRCKNSGEIKEYMYKWISGGDRVAIFTRDMSWVDNDRMKSLLKQKANKNELTVLLERQIPLSEELQKHGAEIITYAHLEYTPESRFTIINKDRSDAKVAVGGRIGDYHTIYEFRKGHDPHFSIASDLVNVLTKVQQKM